MSCICNAGSPVENYVHHPLCPVAAAMSLTVDERMQMRALLDALTSITPFDGEYGQCHWCNEYDKHMPGACPYVKARELLSGLKK